MYKMNQKSKKDLSVRAVQNILPIGLLLVEVVFVFSGAGLHVLSVNLGILVVGVLSGFYLILTREAKDGRMKDMHISTVASLLCWIWFTIAILVLVINPSIYGTDFDAVMPAIMNVGGSAALGMIFITTALVVTAKTK